MVELLVKRPSEILRRRRDEVVKIVTHHGGSDILVFGSIARGDDVPGSDIDLIVSFQPGNVGFRDLIALENELAAVLDVDVNVVSAGSVRLTLR